MDQLVASTAPTRRLRTNRTSAYLRWRYELAPLHYRALTLSDRVADGLAIFRLRRRGAALECALCDLLVPAAARDGVPALERAVAQQAGADYVIRLGGHRLDRAGYLRLPRQGPILTWRPLAPGSPGATLDAWALGLGDVELF